MYCKINPPTNSGARSNEKLSDCKSMACAKSEPNEAIEKAFGGIIFLITSEKYRYIRYVIKIK
jgi:hypothetical protein